MRNLILLKEEEAWWKQVSSSSLFACEIWMMHKT
jgi:hypothetical protein